MNDIGKQSTGIVIKGIAKRALAAFGIPGEVVDVVALVVTRALTNPNDTAAQAAFKQLTEEIHGELTAKSAEYKDNCPPTTDDVEQALIRFAKSYKQAGSHSKRRILFTAFHNSFRPEFYDKALSKILWEKVEALEYPDFVYLQKLLEQSKEKGTHDRNPSLTWGQEYEFGRRLETHHLTIVHRGVPGTSDFVAPVGLAPLLPKFALEELWKED